MQLHRQFTELSESLTCALEQLTDLCVTTAASYQQFVLAQHMHTALLIIT